MAGRPKHPRPRDPNAQYKTTINLTEGMRRKLSRQAADNKRSVGAEIRLRLERSFTQPEQLQPAE